jgi:hypothetical protein
MARFCAHKAALKVLKAQAVSKDLKEGCVMEKNSLWAVGGLTRTRWGQVDNFDGQSVQALIDEILQRIIHKPMARYPRQADKSQGADSHTKVGTFPGAIRPGMTGMLIALVFDR